MTFEELLIVFGFLVLFSLISYFKKLLDFEGILVGNIVGLAAISYAPEPVYAFLAVVALFVFGEIASNFPISKHKPRGISNVVGNSLPALLCIVLIVAYPEYTAYLEIAFFGAIAAALADTLSSEVGYYSRRNPILITTFKEVPRGTDGGITPLGELAALGGGIVIALIYFVAHGEIITPLFLVIAGMVGTNVDSFFGAVLQRKKVLNNTQVNLLGSLSGAIAAALLAVLL